MTLSSRRYIATAVQGKVDGLSVYAATCAQKRSGESPKRQIGHFLGMSDGGPLYAVSSCEFPQMGRYLTRYAGLADLPIYALVCCEQSSSGQSGSSGPSGSSGTIGSSGQSGSSGPSGSLGSLASSGLSGSSGSSGPSGSSGSLGSSGSSGPSGSAPSGSSGPSGSGTSGSLSGSQSGSSGSGSSGFCPNLWIGVFFNGPSGGLCSIGESTEVTQVGAVNELNGCSAIYGEYSFWATCSEVPPTDCYFPNPFFSWLKWYQGADPKQLAADLGIPAECYLEINPIPNCCNEGPSPEIGE